MKKYILIIVLSVLSFSAFGQFRRTPDRYNEYKLGAYTFTRDTPHIYVCEFGFGESAETECFKVYMFMIDEEFQARIKEKWNVVIASIDRCPGSIVKDGPGGGHYCWHIRVRMQDKDDLEAENQAYEVKKAKEWTEMNERFNSLENIFD